MTASTGSRVSTHSSSSDLPSKSLAARSKGQGQREGQRAKERWSVEGVERALRRVLKVGWA
eukprot:3839374-Rhodomonas_salina.1